MLEHAWVDMERRGPLSERTPNCKVEEELLYQKVKEPSGEWKSLVLVHLPVRRDN